MLTKPQSSTASLWSVLAVCALGAGLMYAPAKFTAPVRNFTRDTFRPGQWAAQTLLTWSRNKVASLGSGGATQKELLALQSQLRAAELRNRQILSRSAALDTQLTRAEATYKSIFPAEERAPLFKADLVQANVLSQELAREWKGKKVISGGRAAGIVESALVLDSPLAQLDQGQDARLAVGNPVFSGRIVIGNIAAVGQWTSTLRLVTDPSFAASARLYRITSAGKWYGGEATLKGDGKDLCRLESIPFTEASPNVGDAVVTGSNESGLPCPMYFGKVVKAELPEGATHWAVWVQPAIAELRFETVQVLRTIVNEERLAQSARRDSVEAGGTR